jgi:cytochrome c oxidase cbb3-type subunit 3
MSARCPVLKRQAQSRPSALHCFPTTARHVTALREFGAPNLTDGIWLYGGDKANLTTTVNNARYGVMPRWNNRLDPVTIKMLAAYVHSLGGGEANPAPAATPLPKAAKVAANVQPEGPHGPEPAAL